MVSQRKRNANQQNAKSSTGPGDTGKTRFNALQHGMSAGFLSKEAIVEGGPGKEDPEELEALRNDFWDYWVPEGLLEEQLVDQLVMLAWRERRIVRHEAAAIRDSQERALAEGRGVLDGKQMDEDVANAFEESKKSARIVELRIVYDDPLPEEESRSTQEANVPRNDTDDSGILGVPGQASERPSPGRRPEAATEGQLIPSLPSAKVLDKVQRYESHISRLRERALRLLLAVQAARRQRSELALTTGVVATP